MASVFEQQYEKFGKLLWNSILTYEEGEIVQHNGQLWAALEQNSNVEPRLDSTAWKVYIQKTEIQFWGRFAGIIIPLYVYPADVFTNTAWNTVIDLAKTYREVPTMAIINPASGPGTVVDGNYAEGLERLQGANIFVLGYISTAFAGRDINAIKEDIDNWKVLYPKTQGIFFDEQPYEATPENLDYYEQISDYAKNKGFTYIISNGGSLTPAGWFDAETADAFVTHENDTYPTESDAKGDWNEGNADYNLNKRMALVHSQTFDTAQVEMMKKYYGFMYVTDDVMPNPWDSVSPYLERLYQTLHPSHGVARVFNSGRPAQPRIGDIHIDAGIVEICIDPDVGTWTQISN